MWVCREPGRASAPTSENETGMKLTPWYLAALAPIAIAGCSGTLMGHVAVLAVAIGIFVGTLSLGRERSSSARADAPTAEEVQAAKHIQGGVDAQDLHARHVNSV